MQKPAKKTIVINLISGPGTGKSTLAAEIFWRLKSSGHSTELCREFVKDWAFENRGIGQYDQFYISAEQAKREYSLYGKVDFIVTDSPLILSSFYQEYYQKDSFVKPAILGLIEKAKTNGVEHIYFLLPRVVKYDTEGRYETEAEARAIDAAIVRFLDENHINHIKLTKKTYPLYASLICSKVLHDDDDV